MTLRDCIGLTIKKHPDYNCEAILKTYFRIKNGIIPSDGMVNLNAFSSLVDHYKPREEISKLGRRGVISELERETNMQANRVGLLKLIEEYSTRYYTNSNNNVSKNNVANIIYDDYIMVRVNDINELKKIIDDLDSLGYKNEVKESILCNSYLKNPSIQKIIDKANEDFNLSHHVLLGDEVNTRIKNFLTYINNYYDVINEENHKSQVKNNSKELDSVLKLNLNNNLKADILTNLYYGNDTNFSDILPYIEKEKVMIALIRNAIQVGLVSTNVRDRSNEEYVVYKNVPNKEDALIWIKRIKDKLLATKADYYLSEITPETLKQTIDNLEYQDVQFLSRLYLQTRSDSKSVEILEMAQNRSYKIEEGNMIEYENSSQLLKILDSKEFMETLKDNYHM